MSNTLIENSTDLFIYEDGSPLGREEFAPNLQALLESDIKNKKTDTITCHSCGNQFLKLDEEDKLQWWTSQMKCPKCNTRYCNLDKTEQQLRILQDDYYIYNKEKKILEEMYKIFVPYAGSLILKRHTGIEKEDLQYHSHCAAWYLLERYYKEQYFYIAVSFGTALDWKVTQTLYSKGEKPLSADCMSLDYEYTDNHKDMYGLVYREGNDPSNTYEKVERLTHLKDNLLAIINEIDQYSTTKTENLMRLIAIRNFLRYGHKNVDKFFSKYGRDGKRLYEMTLDIVKSELAKN